MLAACDNELLGTTLVDDAREIEVHISAKFYGGQTVSAEELCGMLADATIINLFGENTVNAAKDAGYIDEGCIIMIAGVPHAIIACL